MANVSKLLYTTTDPESFLENLNAEDGDLKAAKAKIRGHLREAFSKTSRDLFGQEVCPRFFTQGSSSYKTLNDPAWPPSQQKDLDDGCYLPLSFVKGEQPSKAAEQFFKFVDAVLGELAKAEVGHSSRNLPASVSKLPWMHTLIFLSTRSPTASSRCSRRGLRKLKRHTTALQNAGKICPGMRSCSHTVKMTGWHPIQGRSTSGLSMP